MKRKSLYKILSGLFISFLLILTLTHCSSYTRPLSVTENQCLIKRLHSQCVHISGGQIEYYTFGTGSPLILIPGFATDISSWDREFLVELARCHKIYVLNNRNIGRSKVKTYRCYAKDLAQDVYEMAQNLHLYKPIILGMSMGGMVAQKYAIMYPENLSHLILINTAIAGKCAVKPADEVAKRILTLPDSKVKRYMLALKVFFPEKWKTKMAYRLLVERFQPACNIEVNPKTVMAEHTALLFAWNKDNETAYKLRSLQVPTLIMAGDCDIVIPSINSVILAKSIPHSTLIWWREGGHAVTFQYPIQVAEAINDYICSHK